MSPFFKGGIKRNSLFKDELLLFRKVCFSKIEPSPLNQMVSQEALTRLLIEKGIFTKEEFLEMEMVKVVDGEMNRKRIF